MAEEIILRVGFEQLPVAVGSLLLAAGAAIIISTGNTFLMVTSTNVTRDILQMFFATDAAPSQLVRLQRGCIVAIGVLAYVMMSQFETILEMALISYTMIGASLAPALARGILLEACHADRGGLLDCRRNANCAGNYSTELHIQGRCRTRANPRHLVSNGYGLHRTSRRDSHRIDVDPSELCDPKTFAGRLARVY